MGWGGNDVRCWFVGSDILKIQTMHCLVLIFSLQSFLSRDVTPFESKEFVAACLAPSHRNACDWFVLFWSCVDSVVALGEF